MNIVKYSCNILISDAMKSLEGSLYERVVMAFEADIDIVLYRNQYRNFMHFNMAKNQRLRMNIFSVDDKK